MEKKKLSKFHKSFYLLMNKEWLKLLEWDTENEVELKLDLQKKKITITQK